MIFHFQILGPAGWESLGSGVGTGEEPVRSALADLRDLSGGRLQDGSYRHLQVGAADATWQEMEVLGGDLRAE